MSKFTSEQKELIQKLASEICEICDGERNQETLKKWVHPEGWNRDLLRGEAAASENGSVPFMVELDNCQISNVAGFDFVDYYHNSFTMLSKQLEYRKWRYASFNDYFPYTKEAYIWFGVATELGMFPTKINYYPHREPWVDHPIIEDEDDLEKLEIPDFYKSGIMPRVHEFYEDMSELLDGTELKPMFPSWARSPFCIASHLMGLQNILVDMIAEPELVHKVMRYTTDSIKSWETERARFTGEPLKRPHKMFDDEIDCPTMSPEMYREFVLPYEKELSEFFGGLSYWHSCGAITKIIPYIHEIPDITMFHVGPWTDLKTACEIFAPGTAMDVCLKPDTDVYFATPEQMKEKLTFIRETGKQHRIGVRADVFEEMGDWNENLKKILTWIDVAHEVLD